MDARATVKQPFCTQVLSGEMRFLRIRAYPDNCGKMAARSREMAIPSCEHGIRTAAVTADQHYLVTNMVLATLHGGLPKSQTKEISIVKKI